MKISMFILEHWLRKNSFKVEPFIRDGAAELQVVRITDNITMNGVAGVSVRDAKTGTIIIANKEDFILVIDSAVEDVFNSVSAAFEYYNAWESALLRSVFEGCTLQDLLDIAQLAFSRPMLIQNSQYEIVAITDSYGIINPIWDIYKKKKEKNGKTVHLWLTEGHFNSMSERVSLQEPTILSSHTNPGKFILANLFLQGIRVGHIVMYENSTLFYPGDLQLMKAFQAIIAFYIGSKRSVLFQSSILDAYLNQNLDGIAVHGESVALKAVYSHMGWSGEDHFLVVYFSLADEAVQEEYDWVQSEINLAVNEAYTVLTSGGISVLCRLTDASEYDEISRCLEGIRRQSIRSWGMSQPFQGLQQLNGYGRIAREIAHVAEERGRRSLNIRDAGLELLMRDKPFREQLERLVHPEYLQLRRYDRENHTQLAETVFWYLYSNGNYSDTALRMESHRNTVYNRIAKAFELVDAGHLETASSRLLFQISYLLDNNEIFGNQSI